MTFVPFPGGAGAHVDDAVVAGFVGALAGAESDDRWLALGDLVHDVADELGSRLANAVVDEADAEALVGRTSMAGSDVVNDGVTAMVRLLVAFHGPERAGELVAQVAAG